ncbi:MAG TPA: hypothetical protein PK303_09155, partial [bacterium]|nr:hypothetical protein [bacterium]
NLLKKYGATPQLFFCPAVTSEFNKYGTNYLWNEAVKGKQSSDAPNLWLMTEITSLYPELPTPHTGGYGILYADGHAQIGRNISFPSFQKPSLALTGPGEKPKEETSVEEKKEEVQETKVLPRVVTYQVINLPSKIQAGKFVPITIRAVDNGGNIVEKDEKVKILDLTQTIEPSEVSLQKGIGNVMVQIKKFCPSNVLIVVGSEGLWSTTEEFTVESGEPASIEILPPTLIYAGIPSTFTITVKDTYGNTLTRQGVKILASTSSEAEYPSEFFTDTSGRINASFVFHKAGENRVNFSIAGTTIRESCSVKVRPGLLERFEISPMKSPIEAGTPVSITIKALDRYGNRAKGFTFHGDTNMPGYVQEDMSSGIWMETITFEKAVSETYIVVSDGMGHIGRSNSFSVIPSYPAQMKMLEFNPIAIQQQVFEVKFCVLDRYGNRISGLESSISAEGVADYKISRFEDVYIFSSKFDDIGKKNIKIVLKENKNPVSLEFFVDVLPKKPVLKKGE